MAKAKDNARAKARDPDTGKFLPGWKGGGRPPKQSPDEDIRKLLYSKAPELVQRAINLVLEGDIAALRMCMDRVWPVRSVQVEEMQEQIVELREQIERLRRLRVV